MEPSNDQVTPTSPSDVGSERLQRLLEALSLTRSEARTMLALFRFGSATLNQLAQTTGISRSNLYPVLDSLQSRGVAQRLMGRYSVWTSPGPAEVLDALKEAEEARLIAARDSYYQRVEEARTGLVELPNPSGQTAAVIAVDDDAVSGVMYQEAMASVEGQILVFNRGPYAGDLEPVQEVLDSVSRGVKARAIYQAHELDDPALRQCADAYGVAGVDQRVVDELPVSMAVLGEQLVLLSLPADDEAAATDFHTATVRNRGMVKLVSAAFDHIWASAAPYVPAATATTPKQQEEQAS